MISLQLLTDSRLPLKLANWQSMTSMSNLQKNTAKQFLHWAILKTLNFVQMPKVKDEKSPCLTGNTDSQDGQVETVRTVAEGDYLTLVLRGK